MPDSISKRYSILSWTHSVQWQLDPMVIIPLDIVFKTINEFCYACVSPVTTVKYFVFQTPEEPLTGRIVGRTSFSWHGSCQPGCIHSIDPSRPYVMAPAVWMDYGLAVFVKRVNCAYSAEQEHPNRYELNSATALVEHSNRSNWTPWPQRLYIDKLKM